MWTIPNAGGLHTTVYWRKKLTLFDYKCLHKMSKRRTTFLNTYTLILFSRWLYYELKNCVTVSTVSTVPPSFLAIQFHGSWLRARISYEVPGPPLAPALKLVQFWWQLIACINTSCRWINHQSWWATAWTSSWSMLIDRCMKDTHLWWLHWVGIYVQTELGRLIWNVLKFSSELNLSYIQVRNRYFIATILDNILCMILGD